MNEITLDRFTRKWEKRDKKRKKKQYGMQVDNVSIFLLNRLIRVSKQSKKAIKGK